MNRHGRCIHRSGFTLIEVTSSLVAVSVLMLGLSAAVMIGARAIPTPAAVGENDRTVIDTLNRLREDIRAASKIEILSNGSGAELRLEMLDSGLPGSPGQLTYRYIKADNELLKNIDGGDFAVVLTGATIKLNVLTVNARHTALNIQMRVPDTIQQVFEVHAALPEEPVIQ